MLLYGFQETLFDATQNEQLTETVNEILEILPKEFDVEVAKGKYPITEDDCRNMLFIQEVTQYNQLLHCIKTTLQQVLNAIQGKINQIIFHYCSKDD